ncbi:MAG: glycosyltransferase family 2 protein [bacterium]|nr:glycosyltransferase family 2 protein [bacterium]
MISVLIPTYNCGPWLGASLDSILPQLEPGDELVVVDDGSTDDTPAVLAAYGERLRVVPGRHAGLPAARNLCLAEARGDWIAFHDADDVAAPDRLAVARAWLAAHAEFDAVFQNGARMEDGSPVVPDRIAARCDGRRVGVADLFAGFPIYWQGALVPRRAFDAAGPFDARFPVQPDIAYGYRLLPRCRAAFVDRTGFHWRRHPTNTSADLLGTREDIARILEDLPPDVVAAIGARRVRAMIARQWSRVARRRLERGERDAARAGYGRAVALQPLHPGHRLGLWRAS